jgi:hypothetical protein
MRTKITLRRETHEIKIVRRPGIHKLEFCPDCRRNVRWLLPEEAMIIMQRGLREIFRLVESGRYHFIESTDGFLLICADSLSADVPD